MLIKCFVAVAGLLGFTAAKKTCKASDLPALDVVGLEVVNVLATEREDFMVDFYPMTNLPHPEKAISFCNVTVTYTHPGQGSVINAYIWLPLDDWNGRLLGQGGGGYLAGGETLGAGVALGYATANTDAGHTAYGGVFETVLSSNTWALTSKGNVNWPVLQDFAYRAVDDLPKIAKQIIKGFYGEEQKFSYWNGCSTGGRQGLMLAQRTPDGFDGILSIAPAINWATFLGAELWPQVLMLSANHFPAACEFAAIRQAAIQACDGLDGVEDGMIAAPGLCKFDALSVVGRVYDCVGDKRTISEETAKLANGIWQGPTLDGKRAWFGVSHEAVLAGPSPFDGLASTTCDDQNRNCKPLPFPIAVDFATNFVMADPDFDVLSLTEDQFWDLLDKSQKTFASIMNADSPNLSSFKKNGGKLIMWHGLADQVIPPNGSSNYYERVEAQDPNVRDFFRFFEAPGGEHCYGGHGVLPTSALASLIDWVEFGKAPESLHAASTPQDDQTPVKTRILCPFPQVAVFTGGDEDDAASFACGDSFASRSSTAGRDEL